MTAQRTTRCAKAERRWKMCGPPVRFRPRVDGGHLLQALGRLSSERCRTIDANLGECAVSRLAKALQVRQVHAGAEDRVNSVPIVLLRYAVVEEILNEAIPHAHELP